MLTLVTFFLLADPPKLVLPEGHVVYVVKSTDRGTNGFLLPGTKVDVLVAETVDKGKVKASIVLESALIVAVDSLIDKDKKMAVTVSLAIKPDAVKVLDEAKKKGQLRLVLRSPSKDDGKDKP